MFYYKADLIIISLIILVLAIILLKNCRIGIKQQSLTHYIITIGLMLLMFSKVQVIPWYNYNIAKHEYKYKKILQHVKTLVFIQEIYNETYSIDIELAIYITGWTFHTSLGVCINHINQNLQNVGLQIDVYTIWFCRHIWGREYKIHLMCINVILTWFNKSLYM